MIDRVIHCSILRLLSNTWQRQQSFNVPGGKQGALQVVVAAAVAVHHLWMMILQKNEKLQTYGQFGQ